MAWNEPGNNGQRDPWNRNRKGGKSPLDDLLNNARSRLGKMGQGPGSILTGVAVVLVVGLLFSSYTIIGARQAGVVLRFGEYSRTLPPGFHLKLPQPIESVTKVEATRIRSVTDKVAMLTKDENIITIDFTVQYQVDDSRKYLFSLNDPDGTIGAAAEAAVRSAIGRSCPPPAPAWSPRRRKPCRRPWTPTTPACASPKSVSRTWRRRTR